MRLMRGFVGLAPVLVLVAVCQQSLSQTPAKKQSAPAQKAAPAQSAVDRVRAAVTPQRRDRGVHHRPVDPCRVLRHHVHRLRHAAMDGEVGGARIGPPPPHG